MKKSHNFNRFALGLSMAMLLAQSSLVNAADTKNSNQKTYKNYVTDNIQIPFRSGPGYKYKISRMIRTGTPVTVLEVTTNKWARMTFVDKKGRQHEGWMPSVLLQTQPVSSIQLKAQIKQNKTLEQDKIVLSDEITQLKKRLKSTQAKLDTVNKSSFELNKNYQNLKSVSGNASSIATENETLKKQLSEVQNQNNLYKAQINQTGDVVQRQWFLTGGGVLLLGIILGAIFRSPRRKKGWNSL